MGCSQSKIENEEAVARCKDRKRFMKSAVSSRNAFAAAHSSYAVYLKNSGAALNDFAAGEVLFSATDSTSTSSTGPTTLPPHPPIPPPIQTILPPPPPVPDMPPPPLQRAASMPEFVVSKTTKPSEPTIEEEEEDDEEEEVDNLRRKRREKKVDPPPPPSPPPVAVPENREPPPPPPLPEVGNSSWDYFFNVDDMPRGSLGDEEDMRREREENERKVFDERSKRASAQRVLEENLPPPEKTPPVPVPVPEKPPLPEQGSGGGGGGGGGGKGLKKGKQVVGLSGSGSGGGVGEMKRRNVSLVQVFTELDDYFLAASESAREASKLLEAARLHYHSNFADTNGHLDHSERLMRVITWNRSFAGHGDSKDVEPEEKNETHATVLDKLLAWEKKLYDEVKAGEIMKFEYQRKVASLNKQKKHGTNSEALEKIKATVSHLHTRYIVDMQSMDSTVSEINRLRDEQLYPKLIALVEEMAKMWEVMQGYHEKQLNITGLLRSVDISQSSKETTDHHHDRTFQLRGVVGDWHKQFENMVNYQKEYIRALNSWLKLNLIPIESNLKEKVSSPPRAQNPPIQNLLITWHDLLVKLPDEHAKSAIHNFAAVLLTIFEQQQDELKLRAKVEESTRDLEKKQRQYNKWIKEYMQKRMPNDEMEAPTGEDGFLKDEIMVEKEFVLENAKKKLEDDRESYQRQCVHVREKTLTSLKTRLPELFRALSDFAYSSSEMYRNLKTISDSQSHKRSETAA